MQIESRYAPDPVRYPTMTTQELRDDLLINLFKPGDVHMVYSFIDRVMVGSAVPGTKPLELTGGKEMAADYFCQNRELGIMNIGGAGTIRTDDQEYPLKTKHVLYVGRGTKKISFASEDASNPAKFYITSFPAHKNFPTTLVQTDKIQTKHLGSKEASNERTIYKCIVPGSVDSCQLAMGFTELEPGCVWNTMPVHTHGRRMEVYMYFGMDEEGVVFHLMGSPTETRHIVVRNGQAVLSPSWSIHSGCGTGKYTFVWCMGGENQEFDDMDHVGMNEIM